ncbi:hypothetical protein ACWHAM_21645 [Paenibacillus terrae]
MENGIDGMVLYKRSTIRLRSGTLGNFYELHIADWDQASLH